MKDTGIGIPKDSIKKIWERFYKSDLSRGKDKKGTGLGLAIVKEIIQSHGENIDVVSTEGVGTEFIFSLPKPPIFNVLLLLNFRKNLYLKRRRNDNIINRSAFLIPAYSFQCRWCSCPCMVIFSNPFCLSASYSTIDTELDRFSERISPHMGILTHCS